MQNILVEACCGSVDDVYEAASAGVGRVELNSAMFLGGLTPSVGEVKTALGAGVPIMAMVRPRQGGFCYTQREYQTMLVDAETLLEAGAAGIVFGILHEDGTVDEKRCAPLVQIAKEHGKQAVFHRAIDVTPDWKAALDVLLCLKIDRVLTSGQQPSVRDGADTVRLMREYADGRIEILPGAGITLKNVKSIIKETGCDQIHVLLEKPHRDHSTAARGEIYFGGALYPPENMFTIADSAQFTSLLSAIRER
ncbi:copper homeostasis protein CutC [Christensenellaceae bacterium OttesenSCG-928-M15]|nr:copper homeostasis protein CutC [Christensenellaceae bacterium OttesenSCG-928-M15]